MQGLLDHLQELVAFLADHQDVWDCSVVEIFNGPLLENFPDDWMHALRASCPADLLQIPTGQIKDDWPPSLQSFIYTAHRLSLNRNPATALSLSFPDKPPSGRSVAIPTSNPNHVQPGNCTLQVIDPSKAPQNGPSPSAGLASGTPPPGQWNEDPPKTVELDHVVAQGMSPKKRHEVAALAALVASVAREAGATTVIDIGAGQGYLSNVLYYQYGLDVIAVDAAPGHAGVMQKRSVSISKYFRNLRRKPREAKLAICNSITSRNGSEVSQKEPAEGLGGSFKTRNGGETGGSGNGQLYRGRRGDVGEHGMTSANEDELLEGPIAVTSKIDFGDAVAVLDKLRMELAGIGNEKRGAERLLDGPVVLAGLHACGDLSASMLRTFAACPSVKGVVVVSCCYNLVTEAPTEAPSGSVPEPNGRPKPDCSPEPSDSLRNAPSENCRHFPHSPQRSPSEKPSDRPKNAPSGDSQVPVERPENGPSESGQQPPDVLQNGLSGSDQKAPELTENGRFQVVQKPSGRLNTALIPPPQPPGSLHPDTREGNDALESCSGCYSDPSDASCKPSGPGGVSSGVCSHQRYGFPLSAAVKATGFAGLGINGRMLACQSADRWRAQSEAGFADVIMKHTLRAAFQALLARHFPAVWATKPVLGKQKKRPVGGAPGEKGSSVGRGEAVGGCGTEPIVACAGGRTANQNGAQSETSGSGGELQEASPGVHSHCRPEILNGTLREGRSSCVPPSSGPREKSGPSDFDFLPSTPFSPDSSSNPTDSGCQGTPLAAQAELRARGFSATSRICDDERPFPESASERARFVEFARKSLQQLGLPEVSENEIGDLWESLRSSKNLVRPFWTLRTAMAGPLESLLLLDRFMYMEECLEGTSASLPDREKVCTDGLEKVQRSAALKAGVRMFPLFDPEISPRNIVIVGQRI